MWLMPDVKHCGGLQEMKQIAGAARLNDLLIAPHQPAGPMATAATAQVVSTLSNFYILEHAWGEVPWRADLLDPPERIEDGHLLLSEEPGLGHRLNPETVARHRRGWRARLPRGSRFAILMTIECTHFTRQRRRSRCARNTAF